MEVEGLGNISVVTDELMKRLKKKLLTFYSFYVGVKLTANCRTKGTEAKTKQKNE